MERFAVLSVQMKMGHADRPVMGHADRPVMGHADRPVMGHADRPANMGHSANAVLMLVHRLSTMAQH